MSNTIPVFIQQDFNFNSFTETKKTVNEELFFNDEDYDNNRKICSGNILKFQAAEVVETNYGLDRAISTNEPARIINIEEIDFDADDVDDELVVCEKSNNYVVADKGVKYLSEISGFQLPMRKIFNKGKTGCGGTTIALESPDNFFVAMPYASLVKNKAATAEHYLDIYKGTPKNEIQRYVKTVEELGLPIKIVGTYDSITTLRDAIPDRLKDINIMIDEYHILRNAYNYRDAAVQDILYNYEKFQDFVFMSATPIDRKYLFKSLQKVETFQVIWKDEKPNVEIVDCTNTGILENVRHWVLENIRNGKNSYVFMNSLKQIQHVLENIPALNPENTKIIYSKHNDKELKDSQGQVFPRKNFKEVCAVTFLTATGFEGDDVYDPRGVSCVVSSRGTQKYSFLHPFTVKQIMGRNRNSDAAHIRHFVQFIGDKRVSADENYQAQMQILRSAETHRINLQELTDIEDRRKYMKGIGIDSTYIFMDEEYNISITGWERKIQESYDYYINSLFWHPNNLRSAYGEAGFYVQQVPGLSLEVLEGFEKQKKQKRPNKMKQLQELTALHGTNFACDEFQKWFDKNPVYGQLIELRIKTPEQLIADKRSLVYWQSYLNNCIHDDYYTKIILELKNNENIATGRKISRKQWVFIIMNILRKVFRNGCYGVDRNGEIIRYNYNVTLVGLLDNEITNQNPDIEQRLNVRKIENIEYSLKYSHKVEFRKLANIRKYLSVKDETITVGGEVERSYFIEGYKLSSK